MRGGGGGGGGFDDRFDRVWLNADGESKSYSRLDFEGFSAKEARERERDAFTRVEFGGSSQEFSKRNAENF